MKLLSYFFYVFLFFSIQLIAQSGQLINVDIPSPSLAKSLLDPMSTAAIAIYLPPSYGTTISKYSASYVRSELKYPVVYFLPGYGDNVSDWTNDSYGFGLKSSMDYLIAWNKVKEFIVVIVKGNNFMGGAFYVNSTATGNWEDFVVKEVVPYIDNNYRTLKSPDSRAITGHSMGGFGALNLAMLHPDIFGCVYCLSPGLRLSKKSIY